MRCVLWGGEECGLRFELCGLSYGFWGMGVKNVVWVMRFAFWGGVY